VTELLTVHMSGCWL